MNEFHNGILKFLQEERNKIRSLQGESNIDIGNKQIMIINQKREFFWRVATLSLGLSGGLTFFYEKNIHREYFYLSLTSFALVVVFTIFWTREILDSDFNDLQKLQDKYNVAAEEKINLIDRFVERIEEFSNSEDFLSEYFEEVKKMSSAPILIADAEELDNARKSRGTQSMDYSGECVVFLFLVGIVFSVFSLIRFEVNYFIIFFIILLILSFSFSDKFLKYVKKISEIATTLSRKQFFKRNKNR